MREKQSGVLEGATLCPPALMPVMSEHVAKRALASVSSSVDPGKQRPRVTSGKHLPVAALRASSRWLAGR